MPHTRSRDKHNNDFDEILRLNGYPQHIIDETFPEEAPTPHTIRHNNNTDCLYLQIPYISDAVDYKIITIFKKKGLPVRITHKSTTLRQILKPKNNNPTSCNQTQCATSKDNLCFERNVVYQITCNECHQSHIGSTIRRTHDRIKKHLSLSTSSVYKHFASSHDLENLENRISVKIVARETDPVNVQLKEAFYIRKQKPEINSTEECSELTDLLF